MQALTSVFHVDDDEDIRELARMALEIVGGLEVHQCSSGEQAIADIADREPDLILLDVMMPDTDGPSLLKNIRETYPEKHAETPVIFMTGKAEASFNASLAGPGVLGVVSKPFDPMVLPDRLARMLNGETFDLDD